MAETEQLDLQAPVPTEVVDGVPALTPPAPPGTLFVFFNIAEVAALPRVVPKSQIAEATAQNQAAFGVAGIAGPSIGTFLYGSLGRMAPFIADAVSYLVSVVSLYSIKTRFQTERPQ